MLEIIEKANKMIKKSNYESLIIEMSRINDIKEFSDILNSMTEEDKKDFEDAVIGLTYYETMTPEEKLFLEKYENYCFDKATNDSKYYFNNRYLRFLYINKVSEYISDSSKEVKMNGIDMLNLMDNINNEYNNLIQKMNVEDLNDNDKKFIKNFFDVCSDYFAIEKSDDNDIMHDVVKFFDEYPLENLETPENKKMHILYTLSKELIKYDCNSLIRFNNYDAVNSKEMAFFKKIDENTGIININRMNSIFLGSDKEFIEKLFTIYHELGHFEREFGIRKYTSEEKELIDMELNMIRVNRDFYLKYHDNFFLERDADSFAIDMLRENFLHEELKSIISDILDGRNLIDQNLFMNIFLKEYNLHECKDLSSESQKK